jgi:hypothetical protein
MFDMSGEKEVEFQGDKSQGIRSAAVSDDKGDKAVK